MEGLTDGRMDKQIDHSAHSNWVSMLAEQIPSTGWLPLITFGIVAEKQLLELSCF